MTIAPANHIARKRKIFLLQVLCSDACSLNSRAFSMPGKCISNSIQIECNKNRYRETYAQSEKGRWATYSKSRSRLRRVYSIQNCIKSHGQCAIQTARTNKEPWNSMSYVPCPVFVVSVSKFSWLFFLLLHLFLLSIDRCSSVSNQFQLIFFPYTEGPYFPLFFL